MALAAVQNGPPPHLLAPGPGPAEPSFAALPAERWYSATPFNTREIVSRETITAIASSAGAEARDRQAAMDSPERASPSSAAPARPKLRLSAKHGASVEAISSYMASLCVSLRRTRVLGLRDNWTPSSADVRQCYRFVREIGRGHFGVVRQVEEVESRQSFACKSILKSSIRKEEDVSELLSEVTSLLRLRGRLLAHQNIIQLHEVLEDEEAVHLVLDYCGGGDLFDHISHQKRMGEKETAFVFKQLLSAVQCMHLCGLVHRDLKPENVLLTKPKAQIRPGRPEIKVADFGLCVALGRGQLAKGVAGSPFYMAPEVIKGKPYGKEVDVWSLGVILYTCLSGCLPFWGKGHDAVFAAVCRAKPDFTKKPWPLVSPEAKQLIRAMLNADPAKRISLADVMAHPWMLHHCPELKQQLPKVSAFGGRPISASLMRPFGTAFCSRPSQATSSSAAQEGAAAPAGAALHLDGARLPVTSAAAPPGHVGGAEGSGTPAAHRLSSPVVIPKQSPNRDGRGTSTQGTAQPGAPSSHSALIMAAQASTQESLHATEATRAQESPAATLLRPRHAHAPSFGDGFAPLAPPQAPAVPAVPAAPAGICESPRWVLQLAVGRVEQALQGAASLAPAAGGQKGHDMVAPCADSAPPSPQTGAAAASAGAQGAEWHGKPQDLHLIPSPPQSPQTAASSRCSSPALRHPVQSAVSLAHPFPHLYFPSTNSNCSPAPSNAPSPALPPLEPTPLSSMPAVHSAPPVPLAFLEPPVDPLSAAAPVPEPARASALAHIGDAGAGPQAGAGSQGLDAAAGGEGNIGGLDTPPSARQVGAEGNRSRSVSGRKVQVGVCGEPPKGRMEAGQGEGADRAEARAGQADAAGLCIQALNTLKLFISSPSSISPVSSQNARLAASESLASDGLETPVVGSALTSPSSQDSNDGGRGGGDLCSRASLCQALCRPWTQWCRPCLLRFPVIGDKSVSKAERSSLNRPRCLFSLFLCKHGSSEARSGLDCAVHGKSTSFLAYLQYVG